MQDVHEQEMWEDSIEVELENMEDDMGLDY